MIVEISTNTLKEFGISADDFLYLFLLSRREYDLLVELNLSVELEELQTKGLIKIGEGLQSHVVRDKFVNYKSVPEDQMWSELLSYFPLKVTGPRGEQRILRSKDAEASNNAQAKKRYLGYIKGNSIRHAEVVTALQTELKMRTSSGNLFYMQMLNTWVNQRTWEQYMNIDADEPSSTRITRKL